MSTLLAWATVGVSKSKDMNTLSLPEGKCKELNYVPQNISTCECDLISK